MIRSAGRYWRTVRYLRPCQVYHQVRRRLLPPGVPARAASLGDLRVQTGTRTWTAPFVHTPMGASTADAIRFLNAARILDPAAPDWVAADAPKLWRYNLHYFDCLQWPVIPAATGAALVDDWIGHVRPGAADAWEPYPLSLRIVNWIKFWTRLPTVPPAWQASLELQCAALAGDIEYHLLANHLLKNGKALAFAGCVGSGGNADDYLATGLGIVLDAIGEQVLADGGHVERSPMYHCIVLEDYLDLVNLATAFPERVPASVTVRLVAAARRLRDFLCVILGGDERIPLFNDAAFGIAPEPAVLLGYAARLLDGLPAAPPPGDGTIELAASGYFGYRRGMDSLIVDCGEIGPDYQPGHAHCDTLSYELCVSGARVVVDAGVYSYEPDTLRAALRSTASHNTVCIDGEEQSEVWAAFRVGRRARPLESSLRAEPGGRLVFNGAHDGYRRLVDSPVHRRRIEIDPAGSWEVVDVISGGSRTRHSLESAVHLAPELEVTPVAPGCYELAGPGLGRPLRLEVTCGSASRVTEGYYCPEFGILHNNKTVVIERDGLLPLETRYRIQRC